MQYFELTSANRNRDLYPLPGNFVVDLAQTGIKTRAGALDVVSNASPILVFNANPGEVASTTGIIVVTITPSTTPPMLYDNSIFQVTVDPATGFRLIENFYVGCVLSYTDSSGNAARRRVIASKVIDLSNAIITVDAPIDNIANGSAAGLRIAKPSSFTQVWIPTGSFIDNFYVNYYMQSFGPDCALESAQITEYDGTTRIAVINPSPSSFWEGPLVPNNNFALRKELPVNSGDLLAVSTNGKILQLASTANSESDSYISSYIRMLEPLPTYADGLSVEVPPYNEERRIVRYIAGNGKFVAISSNTFTLNSQASDIDDYYTDSFLTDTTTGVTRQITSYTGSTKSGTVASAWGAGAVNDNWIIRSAFLQSTFTTDPVVGSVDAYEVEQFTRDNVSPLNYIGSLVSVSEEVCYEVGLVNLVIPNLTLASGRGGRPAFYPYFYVLFEPVGASGGQQKNLIYSNNPNSSGKLFRVPADDTPTPLLSTFIKLDSDGMTHVIKFKPTQAAFRFAVYHADGSIFETVQQDTTPPTAPNPSVQISAQFSFKRI